MPWKLVALVLGLAACNPRPVACDTKRGMVKPGASGPDVQHCTLDQVCCAYGAGVYGCGDIRQPTCTPQPAF